MSFWSQLTEAWAGVYLQVVATILAFALSNLSCVVYEAYLDRMYELKLKDLERIYDAYLWTTSATEQARLFIKMAEEYPGPLDTRRIPDRLEPLAESLLVLSRDTLEKLNAALLTFGGKSKEILNSFDKQQGLILRKVNEILQ